MCFAGEPLLMLSGHIIRLPLGYAVHRFTRLPASEEPSPISHLQTPAQVGIPVPLS